MTSDRESNKTDDETKDIKYKAYDLLTRREHSRYELKNKLIRAISRKRDVGDESIDDHSFDTDAVVESVLDDLIQQGLQSDARYAEMLCRSRYNSGKGPVKLQHELSQQKLTQEIIDTALAPYHDLWAALAEEVRVKKFGQAAVVDFKEWSKQSNFLLRRGFSHAHIGSFDTD